MEAAIAGLAVGVTIAALCKRGRQGFSAVLLAMLYFYVAIGFANAEFDRARPQVFHSVVTDKHQTYGKGHASYLTLRSWGPKREGGDESVPAETYNRLSVGADVCVYVYPGALRVRWYYIDACS